MQRSDYTHQSVDLRMLLKIKSTRSAGRRSESDRRTPTRLFFWRPISYNTEGVVISYEGDLREDVALSPPLFALDQMWPPFPLELTIPRAELIAMLEWNTLR